MQTRREGPRQPPTPGMGEEGSSCGGAEGQPPPHRHRHPAPTGCPLWQRARKERRGTAPRVRHSEPHGTRPGGRRATGPCSAQLGGMDLGDSVLPTGLGARIQPGSNRQRRRQDSRTPARDRQGRMSPSISQVLPPPPGEDRSAQTATGDNTQLRDRTRQDGPRSPTHGG